MTYETVIGLEVHAQLKTKSKLFSGAPVHFGAAPNTQTSLIDAGLPGVLPVLNRQAVIMAIQFGLAIEASINQQSVFERKNYFYPDLPKGYQISQFQQPIVSHGHLDIQLANGQSKSIIIERAHLEEDAGKSLHEAQATQTGIDLNRAGTPLLEIVTTPCLHSSEEVIAYLKTLHQLVQFIGICDGNMQEGSFRCDVNLSLRPSGSKILGTRTEIKNLNSFRFIEKAIAYEISRHHDLLDEGQGIHQETRLYCPDRDKTIAMRSKENEQDYRYFPDPDLLPVIIDDLLLNQTRDNMPILPQTIKKTLESTQQLSATDIQFLLSDKAIIDFYMEIKQCSIADEKTIVNWLKGPYSAALNEQSGSFKQAPISANELALLLDVLFDKQISNHQAKSLFQKAWQDPGTMKQLIAASNSNPEQSEEELIQRIESLLARSSSQVKDYQQGKTQLLGFFIGQIMKETRGQVDPALVHRLVTTLLNRASQ